jgi:hypothetical protein
LRREFNEVFAKVTPKLSPSAKTSMRENLVNKPEGYPLECLERNACTEKMELKKLVFKLTVTDIRWLLWPCTH